jgi:hypothetical protein
MYQTQEDAKEVYDLYDQMIWDTEHLTIQNSTYTELTNSGNLNIFKNQELKNSIISYYRESEKAAKGIAEWDEVSTRSLIHLGHSNPNHVKFNSRQRDVFEDLPLYKEDWNYFNDPSSVKFQTVTFALAIYKLKHADYLDVFQTLEVQSKKLINYINKELESRN